MSFVDSLVETVSQHQGQTHLFDVLLLLDEYFLESFETHVHVEVARESLKEVVGIDIFLQQGDVVLPSSVKRLDVTFAPGYVPSLDAAAAKQLAFSQSVDERHRQHLLINV